MRKLKFFVSLLVLLFGLSILKFIVYADTITSEFIDLTFKIDSKTYTSKSISKKLDTAPFVENGSTLVPFRTILEELGYIIEWDSESSTITAKKGDSSIILKIDNKKATVGGIQQEMSVAPKIVSGRTVVPLRFISENSGAKVVWDATTKTIYITKVGKYDTGKVMFYEKSKNLVYVYDGSEIITIPLENQEIVNWYNFKGQVLLTMFDKARNTNSFQIFRGDKFEVLTDNLGNKLDSFDMKETFEYNDNLLIHGYDRNQKFNKLCRFDGQNLYIVQDNFYVGNRFFFKDKLVINKYDNKRNYTLLVFDKSSWNPHVLKDKFIIKDSFDDKNNLYLTGGWQEGTNKPLAVYDGNSVSEASFKILQEDISIDIDKIVMFSGKLHAIVGSDLVTIDQNGIYRIIFPLASTVSPGLKVKYNTNLIKLYNGKLYIGILGINSYVDAQYKEISKPKDITAPKGFVMEIASGYTTQVPYRIDNKAGSNLYYVTMNSSETYYKNILDKFSPKDFKIENEKLLMLGQETDDKDLALDIYDGSKITRALDVSAINNTVALDRNTFISVTDKSRITGGSRNTVLLYSNNEILNLVIGMEMKKWDSVGGSLIISGYEKDIDRNKLYSYGNEFKELISNFGLGYWEKYDDGLFVVGADQDTNISSMYKFTDSNPVTLKDNITVTKMIKAKGKYYFIDSSDMDPNSQTRGKKVLYIYDDTTGNFVEMKVDLKITDMIFVQ